MEGLAKALEHDIMINISLASDQEAYRMRRESLESQWLKKKEEIGRRFALRFSRKETL